MFHISIVFVISHNSSTMQPFFVAQRTLVPMARGALRLGTRDHCPLRARANRWHPRIKYPNVDLLGLKPQLLSALNELWSRPLHFLFCFLFFLINLCSKLCIDASHDLYHVITAGSRLPRSNSHRRSGCRLHQPPSPGYPQAFLKVDLGIDGTLLPRWSVPSVARWECEANVVSGLSTPSLAIRQPSEDDPRARCTAEEVGW
jgi:hypothetical protein